MRDDHTRCAGLRLATISLTAVNSVPGIFEAIPMNRGLSAAMLLSALALAGRPVKATPYTITDLGFRLQLGGKSHMCGGF